MKKQPEDYSIQDISLIYEVKQVEIAIRLNDIVVYTYIADGDYCFKRERAFVDS